MATYREFREQAKRRRRKRVLRRALVFLLAVLVILGLAFLITRLMKGGAPGGASGSSAPQSVSQPQSAASAPESGGAASQAPAPAQDPGDTSWNQMGPVEQTLNYSVNNPDYRLIALPENGVVDYTYRGDNDQWRVPMYATRDVHIDKNTRISQFRIMKNQPPLVFTRVEHLTGPDRGGFGSTGK